MKALILRLIDIESYFPRTFDGLQSIALLAARLHVAWVFFKAGLTKLRDWDTTLFLFEEEYAVPLLPPEVAAYLGTFGELFFPVVLVVGLFSRLGAVGLFFVNIVAVLSLEDIAPAAYQQHLVWGLLLGAIMLWGGGKASLDRFAEKSLK